MIGGKNERKITNIAVAKICHKIEWDFIYTLVDKEILNTYTDLKVFLIKFLYGYENNNYLCEYYTECNDCCFHDNKKICMLWDMIRTAFESKNKSIILTIILKIKNMEV